MGRGEMPITLNKLVTKKGVTKIALAANNNLIDVTINKTSYYKILENKVEKFADKTDFSAYNGRLMSWKKGDLTPSNTNLIIAGVVGSIAVGVGGYFLYKHNLLQKLVKKN